MRPRAARRERAARFVGEREQVRGEDDAAAARRRERTREAVVIQMRRQRLDDRLPARVVAAARSRRSPLLDASYGYSRIARSTPSRQSARRGRPRRRATALGHRVARPFGPHRRGARDLEQRRLKNAHGNGRRDLLRDPQAGLRRPTSR
jgi:hypothetical protein